MTSRVFVDHSALPACAPPPCARRRTLCASRAAFLAWATVSILVLSTAGCAAPQRHAVPKEFVSAATPIGMSKVRDFADRFSPALQQSVVESVRQARAASPRGTLDETGAANVLALSGGGANGAFGAGFLCGWSAAGTRPTFKLVTGISTGAMIAPFAFLGPQYDATLRQAFTAITTKDVYREKSLLEILFDFQSLADSTPLANLIARQVDGQVLAAIAEQHRRGRRLFMGTTNLDAGRLVIWDMGAIAASGRPEALELFRKVMLASASIPIAFPPVRFDVEADGQRYDELHVDGGVVVEVFFYGSALDLDAARRDAGVTEHIPIRLYVIRNGQLAVAWQVIMPRLRPIAERTINGLIGAQVVGDLYYIYTIAKHDGIDFNLAYIPDDFVPASKEYFDPCEMKRLFELGYESARAGYEWQKVPPGLPKSTEESDLRGTPEPVK